MLAGGGYTELGMLIAKLRMLAQPHFERLLDPVEATFALAVGIVWHGFE
jgi:hypothetical protein